MMQNQCKQIQLLFQNNNTQYNEIEFDATYHKNSNLLSLLNPNVNDESSHQLSQIFYQRKY